MWLVTTTGFYSVVSAGRGRVQVRARDRKDLVRLRRRFELQQRIKSTPHADYPFRLIVPLGRWTSMARQLAGDVACYTNFKNVVAEQDEYRARIYGRVWLELREIQEPQGVWHQQMHARGLLDEGE